MIIISLLNKGVIDNLGDCNALQIFIAIDGITSGNLDCTIAGRIISDNTEYNASKCSEE